MGESPFREPRLSADEVRSVLRRIASQPADENAPTVGRDELAQGLAGLGFSPASVRRALDDGTEEWTDDGGKSVLGGPRRLLFEAELPGELPDDAREDVVETIREELGDTGRVETIGRSLTWTPTVTMQNPPRKVSVKVRVREGRTRLRIEEDLSPLRLGAWLGFGIGGGFGLGTLGIVIAAVAHLPALGVAFTLAMVGVSLLLARTVTAALSKRRDRQLGRLFRKLSEEISAAAAPKRARFQPPRAASASELEAEAEADAEADAAPAAKALR